MPFTFNSPVFYRSIRPDASLTMPGLMYYIQEASLQHSRSVGFTMDYFMENRRAWVVTHWQVEVNRMPRWGESVSVVTWPSQFRGFMARRCFSVRNKEGEILAKANSCWVYSDLKEHKVIPMTDAPTEAYLPIMPEEMDYDFKLPSNCDVAVSHRNYVVRPDDIDTNFHVNNCRYVEWAFNDMPDDLLLYKTPKRMNIIYKKECKLGDPLRILLYKSADNNAYLSDIVGSEGCVCQVYTKWE